MRRQESGLLLWVRLGTTRAIPPFVGPYTAAEAAFDAFADSVAWDVTVYGIETTIVMPGCSPGAPSIFPTPAPPPTRPGSRLPTASRRRSPHWAPTPSGSSTASRPPTRRSSRTRSSKFSASRRAGSPDDNEVVAAYDVKYAGLMDPSSPRMTPTPRRWRTRSLLWSPPPRASAPSECTRPADDGAERVSDLGDRIREDLYRRIKLSDLLHPATT